MLGRPPYRPFALATFAVALTAGCTLHRPVTIIPSSGPLPVEYRVGKRVTVETCGTEGMEALFREAVAGHDALVSITLTETTQSFIIFNTTCWKLSATQVDFPEPVAENAGAGDAVAARAPSSAYGLVEKVYAAIGKPMPKDPATLDQEAELLMGYAKAGKSAADILEAAKVGVTKVGKSVPLRSILDAGLADAEKAPSKRTFEEEEE